MPNLTAWRALLNKTDGNAPAATNNAPASRRLDRILSTDRLALIATNRRARAGLKPKSISRFEN